jgi:hypothetical protein
LTLKNKTKKRKIKMAKKITDPGTGDQINNARGHAQAMDAVIHGVSVHQTRRLGDQVNSTHGDVGVRPKFVASKKPMLAP